jgi:hypothetical protein
MSLLARIRPAVEAAPWVVDEVKKLEAEAARYRLALQVAISYQNRCCDLEEIVEMFCLDAEAKEGV